MNRIADFIMSDAFAEKVLTVCMTAAMVFGLYLIGHLVYAIARGAF